MRNVVIGVLSGAAFCLAAWLVLGRSEVAAQPLRSSAGNSSQVGLVTHSFPAGDKDQHLVVMDPKTRVMAVYHVESTGGRVTLKSVRPFGWDLQLNGFNVAKPTHEEIRSMILPR